MKSEPITMKTARAFFSATKVRLPEPKKFHAKNAKRFVATLKKLVKDADLERADLAALTGAKERTIRSWFSGEAVPSEEMMQSCFRTLREEYVMTSRLLAALEAAVLPLPARE